MNSHVAFVAHNDCLAPLCQHDFLPISFTFQVFDLVYMVDFIAIAVCTAADFTDFGLQTFLEGGCVVRIAIRQIGHFFRQIFAFGLRPDRTAPQRD